MTVTTRIFAGFVLAASVAVLGGALLSQYWGGLAPCELCLLQRWPWAVAITIALIVLLAGDRAPRRWVAGVVAFVFAISAGLALYHVGVERHWVPGPSACTASGAGHAQTVEEMKALILKAAPVQCDQVAWSLFGVSMAGWNLFASLVMLACCIAAARRRAPAPQPSLRRAL
ncbi:MAG: disulfide bond formation protein B [Alphaproteobacteria bacterium]|nr:disulfide bond formation protein B [Alphaproteobacteria bacterium]MBV9862136.1 disulfide bond formation protein B [Alphaproteobacteria bacterium]